MKPRAKCKLTCKPTAFWNVMWQLEARRCTTSRLDKTLLFSQELRERNSPKRTLSPLQTRRQHLSQKLNGMNASFLNSSQIRQGLSGLRAFFCLQKVSSPAGGLDMLQGLCIEIHLPAELHLAVIKQRISVPRLPSPSLFMGAIKTHWQKHARNFHSSSSYLDIAKRGKNTCKAVL